MFESHFGLRENPFVAAHQTRYIYPSPEHQEALAHLRYGIENREPFVLITGEVGTGKTTALFDALSEWEGRAIVGLITNSSLTRAELLEEIALRLGLAVPAGASKPHIMVALEQHLLAIHQEGHRAILLLDEAQNLERELLEEIRLLSNLEAGGEKLVQIFLVGQPELEGRLSLPDLRQLRQRIAIHYRLRPLGAQDSERYVHHRIAVAGGHALSIFPPDACAEVYRLTHGIPREMNHLCSQAMICAFVEGAPAVTPDHVRAAAQELEFQSVLGKERRTRNIPPAVERRQGPTVPGAAPPPEREMRAPALPPAAPAGDKPGPTASTPEAPGSAPAAPHARRAEPAAFEAPIPETGPPRLEADAPSGDFADDEDEDEAELPPEPESGPPRLEADAPSSDLVDDEDEADLPAEPETGPPRLEADAPSSDLVDDEDEDEVESNLPPEPESGPPRLEVRRGEETMAAPPPPAPAASGDDWKSWFKSLADEVEGTATEVAGGAAPKSTPRGVEEAAGEERIEESGPPTLESERPSLPESPANEPAALESKAPGEPVVEPAAPSSAFAEALRRAQSARPESHAGVEVRGPAAEVTPAAAATADARTTRRPRRFDEQAPLPTLPPRLREKMARDAGAPRERSPLPTRLMIAAGLLIVVIAGAAIAQKMFFSRPAPPVSEDVVPPASPGDEAPAATSGESGTAADPQAGVTGRRTTPPGPGSAGAATNSGDAAPQRTPPGSEPAPAEPAGIPPPAPSVHYIIAVGTYLNEPRAKREQTRLDTAAEYVAQVSPVHEDRVTMYRVSLGSFPTRSAAERAASDLISKGLVDEARVLPIAGDR